MLKQATISRKFRSFFFINILLIVALSSCARSSFIDPVDFSDLLRLDDTQARQALAELSAKANAVKSYRSLVHVELRKGDYREQFDQVVVFERPASLRLEILSRELHRLLKLVLVKGSAVTVFDREQMELLRGKNDAAAIEKLTGLPLGAEELMLWLVGAVDPRARGDINQLSLYRSSDDGSSILEVVYNSDSALRIKFTQSPQGVALAQVDLCDDDCSEIFLRAEYQYGASMLGTKALPTALILKAADLQVTLKLVFDRPELNPNLTSSREKIFSFTPVSGVKESEL